MKILAVKGSKEHGEEIIKLFEALGGENTQELSGTNTACIYCMDPETKVIESILEPDDNKLYNILDYYPFKDYVNKKVSIHTINMEQGNYDDEVEVLLGDKFEAIVKDGKVVIMKKLYRVKTLFFTEFFHFCNSIPPIVMIASYYYFFTV